MFHLKTLCLFNHSDMIHIVYPEVCFGVSTALAGPLLTTNPSPHFLSVLSRVPQVFAWTWLNLLVTTVANQRLPASVPEDAINKPWRPLPSARLTEVQARRLLLAVLPLTLFVSYLVGGLHETLLLMVLTWIYNDLGAADENIYLRNMLNAFGFLCFSSGASRIASDPARYDLKSVTYQWFTIIGMTVLSTIQLQDMYDQEGDAARGRMTVPLVLGDWPARWTVVVPVIFWSVVCPAFWNLRVSGFVAPLLLGMVIVFRVLLMRNVKADKLSFKFWCLWTVSLYILPLVRDHTFLESLSAKPG